MRDFKELLRNSSYDLVQDFISNNKDIPSLRDYANETFSNELKLEKKTMIDWLTELKHRLNQNNIELLEHTESTISNAGSLQDIFIAFNEMKAQYRDRFRVFGKWLLGTSDPLLEADNISKTLEAKIEKQFKPF